MSEMHPFGSGSHAPLTDPNEMPACYPVKGNADSMQYHRPDSSSYGATIAEVWFASPSIAEAAGFSLSGSHPNDVSSADFEPGQAGHPCTAADLTEMGVAAVAHPYGPGSHVPLRDPREMPDCYIIKGNVDSMLYHRPDSANYGATIAEVWFISPSAADAAGFTLSNTHPNNSSSADFEPGGSSSPCTADQLAAMGLGALAQPYGAGSHAPFADAREMPNCYPIKGNVDSMLFHRPDSANYGATVAEVWFVSPSVAEAAGFSLSNTHPNNSSSADFEPGAAGNPCTATDLVAMGLGNLVHPFGLSSRAPLADVREMPECYPIKGNVDSMLYHRPDSANYGATVAEVWFSSPSAAEAAAFTLSTTHPKNSSSADFELGGSGHPCSAQQFGDLVAASAAAVAAAGVASAAGAGPDGDGASAAADAAERRAQAVAASVGDNIDETTRMPAATAPSDDEAEGDPGVGKRAAMAVAGAGVAAAAGAAALLGKDDDEDMGKAAAERAAAERAAAEKAAAEKAAAEKTAAEKTDISDDETVAGDAAAEIRATVQMVAAGAGTGDTSGDGAVSDDSQPFGPGSHAPMPDVHEMPACHPIKGNAGSMKFHRPDSQGYSNTKAEVWFVSPSAAEAAGFALAGSHPEGSSSADFEPGGSGHPCTAEQIAGLGGSGAGAVAAAGVVAAAAAAGGDTTDETVRMPAAVDRGDIDDTIRIEPAPAQQPSGAGGAAAPADGDEPGIGKRAAMAVAGAGVAAAAAAAALLRKDDEAAEEKAAAVAAEKAAADKAAEKAAADKAAAEKAAEKAAADAAEKAAAEKAAAEKAAAEKAAAEKAAAEKAAAEKAAAEKAAADKAAADKAAADKAAADKEEDDDGGAGLAAAAGVAGAAAVGAAALLGLGDDDDTKRADDDTHGADDDTKRADEDTQGADDVTTPGDARETLQSEGLRETIDDSRRPVAAAAAAGAVGVAGAAAKAGAGKGAASEAAGKVGDAGAAGATKRAGVGGGSGGRGGGGDDDDDRGGAGRYGWLKWLVPLILLALLLALLLSLCGGDDDDTAAVADADPTAAPLPTATAEPEPTATPEPEPTATPEPEPTPTTEPEPTPTTEPEPVGPTLIEALQANGFTSLLAAVAAADAGDALANAGPLTVFAPNDAAFAAVPEAISSALLTDPDLLTQVLQYHAVAGSLMAADLEAGSLQTINGSSIAIGTGGAATTANTAGIVNANLDAGESVIHELDAVLVPPSLLGLLGIESLNAAVGGADIGFADGTADFTDADSATLAAICNLVATEQSVDGLPPVRWQASGDDDLDAQRAAAIDEALATCGPGGLATDQLAAAPSFTG